MNDLEINDIFDCHTIPLKNGHELQLIFFMDGDIMEIVNSPEDLEDLPF